MRLRELRITYHPVAGAPPGPRPRLSSAGAAAGILRPLLDAEAVEVFGLLLLNTKHELLGWHVVSRGGLDATLVHPRDAIKAACLANAAAVIAAHNHPSGVMRTSAFCGVGGPILRDSPRWARQIARPRVIGVGIILGLL